MAGEHTSPDLVQMFHPTQLEEKFGGMAKDVESQFWPPVIQSDVFDPDPE